MQGGRLAIETRQCLAYYLLRRLGLHRNTDDLPSNEQQVVLLNREELVPMISELRPSSSEA